MQNVCLSVFFFSNTEDFAFASVEKMSTKMTGFSLTCRLSTSTYINSSGRYGLKKFYPSLKITLKRLQDFTLFKDFETIFEFNLLNSVTDHYFGQILIRIIVFLSDDELIFLLLFETMISQACK